MRRFLIAGLALAAVCTITLTIYPFSTSPASGAGDTVLTVNAPPALKNIPRIGLNLGTWTTPEGPPTRSLTLTASSITSTNETSDDGVRIIRGSISGSQVTIPRYGLVVLLPPANPS